MRGVESVVPQARRQHPHPGPARGRARDILELPISKIVE
jgi:hypothetical protein